MYTLNFEAVFTMGPEDSTVSCMTTEPTAQLQIHIPRRVRNRLKAEAAVLELDMGTLGGAVLDYGLSLLAAGKPPAALTKLIETAKKRAEEEEQQSE